MNKKGLSTLCCVLQCFIVVGVLDGRDLFLGWFVDSLASVCDCFGAWLSRFPSQCFVVSVLKTL